MCGDAIGVGVGVTGSRGGVTGGGVTGGGVTGSGGFGVSGIGSPFFVCARGPDARGV